MPTLLLHFGYHKCLTLFFSRVYRHVCYEFDMAWLPVYDDSIALEDAIGKERNRIVLVTDNSRIPWCDLPDFRACHIIRDPRDLVVSGYFYHLWTSEDWCKSTQFDWTRITTQEAFSLVESDPDNWPRNISYQAYLNSLDQERGLLVEMLNRNATFGQMASWNYENPKILELKYEEIVGDELLRCRQIFQHFNLPQAVIARGDYWTEQFALSQLERKEGTHVRSGKSGQWKEFFSARLVQLFKAAHGQLLIGLDYEVDLDW